MEAAEITSYGTIVADAAASSERQRQQQWKQQPHATNPSSPSIRSNYYTHGNISSPTNQTPHHNRLHPPAQGRPHHPGSPSPSSQDRQYSSQLGRGSICRGGNLCCVIRATTTIPATTRPQPGFRVDRLHLQQQAADALQPPEALLGDVGPVDLLLLEDVDGELQGGAAEQHDTHGVRPSKLGCRVCPGLHQQPRHPGKARLLVNTADVNAAQQGRRAVTIADVHVCPGAVVLRVVLQEILDGGLPAETGGDGQGLPRIHHPCVRQQRHGSNAPTLAGHQESNLAAAPAAAALDPDPLYQLAHHQQVAVASRRVQREQRRQRRPGYQRVCVRAQELPRRFQLPFRHRPEQRRLPVDRRADVDVRARVYQRAHHVGEPEVGHHVQRREALRVGPVQVRACLRQHPRRRGVPALDRHVQGGDAGVGHDGHVGPLAQKDPEHARVTHAGREYEGGPVVDGALVDVPRTGRQELRRALRGSLERRIMEGVHGPPRRLT
ncbi:unnamed protein product [Ectocarpus sp. 12 AP-2014]